MAFKPTRFIPHMHEMHQAMLRDIADRIYQGLTFMSPVDTGAFRAHWKVSVSTPSYTYDVTFTDANATKTAAYQVIASLGSFVDFHISNALPYAVALENGHSRQAPSGVVGVTLINVSHYIRSTYGR